MKAFALLFALPFFLPAQTTAYLASSGPAAVQLVGSLNTTPDGVISATPHGLSVGNFVNVGGVCTGAVGKHPSPLNGRRKVKAVINSTTVTLTDLNNVDIIPNGAWISCSTQAASASPPGVAWMNKVSPFTVVDQKNSDGQRLLACNTDNGCNSVVVSAASSGSATVTVGTSFDPTVMYIPVAVGQHFGLWNLKATQLNTHDDTGPNCTVSSVSSSGWVASCTGSFGGLTNGDYTHNDNCGPRAVPDGQVFNGTPDTGENCVVVSMLAFQGNPIWDTLIASESYQGMLSGNGYKMVFEGGSVIPDFHGGPINGKWDNPAQHFLIDKTNAHLADVGKYALQHVEFAIGVNWMMKEDATYAGVYEIGNNISGELGSIGFNYSVFGRYNSPSLRQTVRDKVYNNLNDPLAGTCSTANADNQSGHNDILGTGTSTAGTTTSITLQTDPGVNITNNIIAFTDPAPERCYGLVTAYNSGTKVATVAAGWVESYSGGSCAAFAPTSVAYTVYATATAAAGKYVSGTITGYNTHFNSRLSAGDAILLTNGWDPRPEGLQNVITAVGGDTSLTAMGMGDPQTRPSVVWYEPKWTTGDCGLNWAQMHDGSFPGAEPSIYPPEAGIATSFNNSAYTPYIGSNFDSLRAGSRVGLDLAFIAEEPDRAGNELTMQQSWWLFYTGSWGFTSWTGFGEMGSFYSPSNSHLANAGVSSAIAAAFPSYPSQDLVNYSASMVNYWVLSVYPDFRFWRSPEVIHTQCSAPWGSDSTNLCFAHQTGISGVVLSDPIFTNAPLSTKAKQLRNWLEGTNWGGSNYWGANAILRGYEFGSLVTNNPNIGSVDYRTLPSQYLFNKVSSSTCSALTSMFYCSANNANAAMISVTNLTDKTATHLMYLSNTYYVPDHNIPHHGEIRLYKVGDIFTTESFNSGPGSEGQNGPDISVVGSMLQVDGNSGIMFAHAGDSANIPMVAPITQWSGPDENGDPAGQYAHVCSNLGMAYTGADSLYMIRCLAHSKVTGADEFIVQWDKDQFATPHRIETHLPYAQNGEPLHSAYPEGHTTVPGSGGAANLNATRRILSLEDGGTAVNVLTAANYAGGLTVTGTIGQTINLDVLDSLGCDAHATVALTGTDAIANGTPLVFLNDGGACNHYTTGGIYYASRPTRAAASNGTATYVSGTAALSGVSGGANEDPPRIYGVVTDILSPGTIFVQSDCPLGGGTSPYVDECTVSSTYPGGFGHNDRFSVCAGSSCGGTATKFESLIIDKIVNGLSDTTLTTMLLNPSTNWTGVQASGARSAFVYLAARGASMLSSVPPFTTTHILPAQYLVSGLVPGSYTVTVGGTPVSGSPFTVVAGANTVEFTAATGGVVSFNGAAPPAGSATDLDGHVKLDGTIVIH